MPRNFAGPDLDRFLQPITEANYQNTLKVLGKQGVDNLVNYKLVLQKISTNSRNGEETGITTQLTKLSAIIREVCKARAKSEDLAEVHQLDKVIQKYQQAYEDLFKKKDKVELENSLKEPYVEWSKLKILYKTPGLKPWETAMLALFDLFPPRRRQDYAHMEVVSRSPNTAQKDKNWLLVNKAGTSGKFIFRQYKTRSVYESQVFDIPQDLFNTLKETGVLVVGKKLIDPQGDGLGLTPDGFGQAFTKLNTRLMKGTHVTVNTYRHSFVTDFLLKNPPYSEKVKVSLMMAHSVGQQSQYDRRESWGVPLCACPGTRKRAAATD